MCTFVYIYKTLIPVLYATSSEVLVMCNFLNLKLIQKYSTLVQKNGKYTFKNKLP